MASVHFSNPISRFEKQVSRTRRLQRGQHDLSGMEQLDFDTAETPREPGNTNQEPKSTTRHKKVISAPKNPSQKKHGKGDDKKKTSSKSNKIMIPSSSSDDSTSSEASDSEYDSTMSSSSSESEVVRKPSRKTKPKSKVKIQKVLKKKSRSKSMPEKEEVLFSSESSSETNDDIVVKKKSKSKKSKAKKRAKKERYDASSNDEDEEDDDAAKIRQLEAQLKQIKSKLKQKAKHQVIIPDGEILIPELKSSSKKKKTKKSVVAASEIAFKRVDQLWDNALHDYKLTETIDNKDADNFEQYLFTVRRKFDWEHKYQDTTVDVRSKPLKEALSHVMEGVRSISLHVATPKLDPNMLFLYLEDMRTYLAELKALSKIDKTKTAQAAALKAKHLKVMIDYLDTDYAEIKKSLYPMLENGTISFDLLWALYKPNTIAYTSTYGNLDEPRAFKVDFATRESHISKGVWYSIEGKYLEYTGKIYGMGAMHCEVEAFKGARSITSLSCYPLKYHKDAEKLKEELIERGKKFVALKGMNYRHHDGMAYLKKKRQVLRVCINGRVMIDPAIFRRINPNYFIGPVKPREDHENRVSDDSSDECCGDSETESEDGQDEGHEELDAEDGPPKKYYKLVPDKAGGYRVVEVEYDDNGEEIKADEKLGDTVNTASDVGRLEFTDEELLIASPVVLGFAFHEKLWLEFSVSAIGDVQWNEGAFNSLVLPENQKSIVKALVSSHKFHPSKNVDDIIANKGLGCTIVLHGPPGTGKTLTAEGIAELLKAPLYMVSAGELGVDPRTLERELQNILDIAHSWGAILLLDEADVFMEKRSLHDIHRNSLVGIFLRLLEYFQGILFLTTNRVETFDDAFQSRIHVALRYGELDYHAKKSVWKMFIGKIRAVPDNEVGKFDENDFDRLARRNLNGRQIKNAAKAAQALAIDEGKPLNMKHVEEVLRVAQSFEQDLKGGTGYEDAMRSYT